MFVNEPITLGIVVVWSVAVVFKLIEDDAVLFKVTHKMSFIFVKCLKFIEQF